MTQDLRAKNHLGKYLRAQLKILHLDVQNPESLFRFGLWTKNYIMILRMGLATIRELLIL